MLAFQPKHIHVVKKNWMQYLAWMQTAFMLFMAFQNLKNNKNIHAFMH